MRMNKVVAGIVLGGILATSTAVAASATTSYPKEGGTWNYGFNATHLTMDSDYFHGEKSHKTSVKHGDNRWDKSIDVIAGQNAHAGLGWVGMGDSRAYYYQVTEE